jgi:hypothetical protein
VTALVGTYIICTILTLLVGLMWWALSYGEYEERDAARLILTCWAWPLYAAKAIRRIWTKATGPVE